MYSCNDVQDSVGALSFAVCYQTASAPARVVSMIVAVDRVAGSILPLTREFSVIPPTFDRLWPFLRHPQLALPKNLPEFRMVYKGRPLHALSRRGYRKHV